MTRNARIIVTIGPATATEQALRQIKGKAVDFVRVNMSHSSLDDCMAVLQLSMKVGLPFIIDTEGSQVRTGLVRNGLVSIDDNEEVEIHAQPVLGDSRMLCLRPASILEQLEVGDLVHVDFDTLVLRIADTSTLARGFVRATAVSGGKVGSNKAVVIDSRSERRLSLPPLSDKDLKAIEMGLRLGVAHIAVSFVRSGESIDEIRRVTEGRMRIIAKIECTDALHNLDDILAKTDAVLIDRGDLSKEIPVERIPFTQKIIMRRARRYGRDVYVATNLLETMVRDPKPTRAEVQDVVNTLLDGAAGLTLAAETAIGAYPMECISVLNSLILHAEQTLRTVPASRALEGNRLIEDLDASGYLLDYHGSSALVQPHGGRLVSRLGIDPAASDALNGAPRIPLDRERQIVLEQIAVGAFSPLEGFLGSADFKAVLDDMRLSNGITWPVPIVLDVPCEVADRLCPGQAVGLTDEAGEVIAILHLSELFEFDRDEAAAKMYGTTSAEHPGVRAVRGMQPVLLAGKIDLVKRRAADAYELTPRQLRRLFAERGWAKILGVAGRVAPDSERDLTQLTALDSEGCDGMFVHLVVGDCGTGDERPEVLIKTYESAIKRHYPKNRVVLATVPACPRFTGPRETLLAALYHKNFGCSHFIAGTSFTRVGSRDDAIDTGILDRFPDVAIKAVRMTGSAQ